MVDLCFFELLPVYDGSVGFGQGLAGEDFFGI